MNRLDLQLLLKAYKSSYLEEMDYRVQMLQFLEENDDFYSRTNFKGHITSSAWVLSPCRQHTILIHHQGLDKWLQMGGHIEGSDATIFDAALREVQEESGIMKVKLASNQIFDIDIHQIPSNQKEPAHLHYDIRLLFEVSKDVHFNKQDIEIKSIKWFSIRDLLSQITLEKSIKRMVDKTGNIPKKWEKFSEI